jgi:hypothetical protein
MFGYSFLPIKNIYLFFDDKRKIIEIVIVMSTWQQHTLSNTTTNQLEINQNINNGLKLVEISDGLGEINHISSLSEDFGM